MTQYEWETGYDLRPARETGDAELGEAYEREGPPRPGRTAPVTAPTAFRPVAVETPGGGRVRDKRDPPRGDLVTVRGLNRPVRLHRLAARAWAALVDAARAEGLREPLLLPVSGYRSRTTQARLYQRALARYLTPEKARRWVAPPGHSAHQSGRAIDFYLGGRNTSSNVAILRRLPAYLWLAANAERFGFYPYQAEPWHWEYNPPATGAAAVTPDAGRQAPGAHRRPPAAGTGPGNYREPVVAGPWSGKVRAAGSALAGSVRGMAEGAAALAGGERNANRLTDIVFHARHPERGGRPIARGETRPAREWVWIRDHLVQPMLLRVATVPAAAPQAPPVTAAGSPSVSHFLKKRPRDPARYRLLASMLDRYRGDIPLEFLLGWIAVESDGCIDVITSMNERGFFQVMPSESSMMKVDHERLTTDPDYSVQAGIQLVRYYMNLARARYPWATPGSELFWRLVKLQHAMGSGLVSKLLSSMLTSNLPMTWEAIKRYEVTDGPRLHRLLNPRDPGERGRFGRNVDKVFQRGRHLVTTLRR